MLGLNTKLLNTPTTTLPVVDYVFIDADASTYYDALVTANGGAIDTAAVHGVSLNMFKENIDTHVIQLKADGIWAKLVYYFPFLGGTAATQAINAVDAGSDLTYVNTPTHNGTGLVLNGSNQYASIGNNPQSEVGQFSHHLMIFGGFTGTDMAIGSRSSATDSCYMREFTSNVQASLNGVLLQASPDTVSDVHICSRTANNAASIYVDGSSVVDDTNTATDVVSTAAMFIGAWSNSGSPLNYATGNVKGASFGDGLSASEASNFTTEVKTFNTNMAR